MKAISLWQPWATLMALGEKLYETRSWPTDERGQVLIYATKKTSDPRIGRFEDVFNQEPFYSTLVRHGFTRFGQLPLGALVSMHNLEACLNSDKAKSEILAAKRIYEMAFGDYSPGRFAFRMPLVKRFREPIPLTYPVKGPSKFFEVGAEILEAVNSCN